MAQQSMEVDETKCSGCGNCVNSCGEGVFVLENGKAKVINQDNCRNSADCLPKCPQGAISLSAVKASKQWPVKLRLVSEQAEFFNNAKLLLTADCAAYTCANFYKDFVHGRTVLTECPKLAQEDFSQKLTSILQNNNVRSLMIVRMDVPCCARLEQAAVEALNNSGKFIPWQVVKISVDESIPDKQCEKTHL